MGDHYLLQFFTWEHLPPHLQAVSKPFGECAHSLSPESIDALSAEMATALPANPERDEALSKLKTARAFLSDHTSGTGIVVCKSFDFAMRFLLEAKDCGVRALVFKPAA